MREDAGGSPSTVSWGTDAKPSAQGVLSGGRLSGMLGRQSLEWTTGNRWGQKVAWGLQWVLWPLLKWGALVALPFGVLMRGGLFLYHQHWPLPLAMGGGVLAAVVVLFFYVRWIYRRFISRPSSGTRTLRAQALVVVLAVGTCQVFLLGAPDSGHVQTEAVGAEYDSLHPLLRTSIATALFVDDRLLITDLSRHPDEYAEMGLPVNPRSLHYRQSDGYVHAVDLHTRRHSMLRNFLLQGYFEVIGFQTRRHGGTADHLHVSLPMPGSQR